MSTQINQYLMWGISLPYKWHQEWEKQNEKPDGFYEEFEDFMDDSAFSADIQHKDGIFCLFDGCNGSFIIIGRVLAKSKDGDHIAEGKPLKIADTLTGLEKELIQNSVKRNFGVEGEFAHYFVTAYR